MPENNDFIPTSGALPDDYRQTLYWRMPEKLIRVILLQILALPLAGFSGLIFFGLAINLGKLPARYEFGLREVSMVFGGILLTLLLHELTHGMVMRMFGATPQVGILWKKLRVYATSPGYAYHRNDYIQIKRRWIEFVTH